MAGKKGSGSGAVSVYSRIYNVYTRLYFGRGEIDEFLATIHMLNTWTHQIQSTFNGTWTHRTQVFASFSSRFIVVLLVAVLSALIAFSIIHVPFIGGKSQVHVIMPAQDYKMAQNLCKKQDIMEMGTRAFSSPNNNYTQTKRCDFASVRASHAPLHICGIVLRFHIAKSIQIPTTWTPICFVYGTICDGQRAIFMRIVRIANVEKFKFSRIFYLLFIWSWV